MFLFSLTALSFWTQAYTAFFGNHCLLCNQEIIGLSNRHKNISKWHRELTKREVYNVETFKIQYWYRWWGLLNTAQASCNFIHTCFEPVMVWLAAWSACFYTHTLKPEAVFNSQTNMHAFALQNVLFHKYVRTEKDIFIFICW